MAPSIYIFAWSPTLFYQAWLCVISNKQQKWRYVKSKIRLYVTGFPSWASPVHYILYVFLLWGKQIVSSYTESTTWWVTKWLATSGIEVY